MIEPAAITSEPQRRRAEIPRGRGRRQVLPGVHGEKHRQHDDARARRAALARARDGSTVIARASAGLRAGSVSTDTAISRKFTSIAVTRMSTPRKKSPARWLPMMPSVAMHAAGEDGDVRRAEARMHRRDRARKDAVLGPREHQARHRQQHRRQVLDQRHRRRRRRSPPSRTAAADIPAGPAPSGRAAALRRRCTATARRDTPRR